jgi:hypothetical protein
MSKTAISFFIYNTASALNNQASHFKPFLFLADEGTYNVCGRK